MNGSAGLSAGGWPEVCFFAKRVVAVGSRVCVLVLFGAEFEVSEPWENNVSDGLLGHLVYVVV